MTRFWPLLAVGAIGAAAALGGATFSWSHGGDIARVHACTTGEGQPLTLSSPNGSCARGATPLDWAIQGPPGPQGPKGDPGPKGAPGPPVTAAPGPVSGTPVTVPKLLYQIVEREANQTSGFPVGRFLDAWAACPAGYQVVNGGFRIELNTKNAPPDHMPELVKSLPVTGSVNNKPRTGWVVVVFEREHVVREVKAIALCLNVATQVAG